MREWLHYKLNAKSHYMKRILGLIILSSTLLFVGCKKRNIRNNLEGTWTLSVLAWDGDNEVSQNSSHSLEFKNVEKDGGDIVLHTVESGTTYTASGTFTFNKDHTELDATLIDGTYQLHWEVDLTVDESNLTLSGISNDNVGSPQSVFLVNGFK